MRMSKTKRKVPDFSKYEGLKRSLEQAIYLVWNKRDQGTMLEHVDLRAVATEKWVAEMYKEMIERDEPTDGVYIEERKSNHLYAHRDVRKAFRMSSVWEKNE